MSILEQLLAEHPVRNHRKQKAAFRAWAVEKAQQAGYAATVEKGFMGSNVVIGDPERAQVVVTAHYDTPARMFMPNFITPRNLPVYLAYQVGVVLLFLIPALAAGLIAGWLGADVEISHGIALMVYGVLLILMIAGPANRHNANDNTSGVAAVMQLMQRLPEEQRNKAAFILFDNEEKGMLGSSAYASKHKRVKKEAFLINLDCVGVGESVLFFAPKKTRELPAYEKLVQAMSAQEGQVEFFPLEKSLYPSDQSQFKHGIAVCACTKGKRVGYYCSRIHTDKDTLCEQRCLDLLSDGLGALIDSL